MDIHIDSIALEARQAELNALLTESAPADAMTAMRHAMKGASIGLAHGQFLELVELCGNIHLRVDILISRCIAMLSNTEATFTETDQRIAQEIAAGGA